MPGVAIVSVILNHDANSPFEEATFPSLPLESLARFGYPLVPRDFS